MTPSIETLTLPIGKQRLAALRIAPDPDHASARVLCLHGWLDNANSFAPLMPALAGADLELVAIDLPGHGLSDHWPGGYSPTDMMLAVVDALDALGWESCHLVGHSLGGCIAPLLACAQPDRLDSLTLIDALGPVSEPAERYPARLQRVLADHAQPERYRSRLFDSEAAAVDARLRVAHMPREAAELIITRQLVRDESGYRWRFDPALRMASTHYVTEAHVHTLLATIDSPTLCIMASDGFLAARPGTNARFDRLRQGTRVMVDGHHHVHMESPGEVARLITAHLAAQGGPIAA